MKNVVVTGGNGFVGSNLIKRLVKENYNVGVIEKSGIKITELKEVEEKITVHYYDGNINKLIKFFEDIGKIQTVYHLASFVLNSHSYEHITSLIESNITFGNHLLEAMYISKCHKMINTSTYWQHYNNELYNPVNLYSATKEAFEKIIDFYTEAKNFNVITLELFDNYGENDKRKKIMNLLKDSFLYNKELKTTKGEQYIDILHVDDLIEGYLSANKLLENNYKHTKYMLSSGERKTLKEIIKIFEKITNKSLNIKYGAIEYKEREIMIPWEEGRQLPNWSPKLSLEEGIKKFLGY